MEETWTIGALKEHFDARLGDADRRYEQRFVDQDKAVDAALTSAKEAVDAALAAAQRASDTYAADAKEKNKELNDVRHRFVPRDTFENYKEDQAKRARATLIAFVLMGLTIVGLLLQILRGP